MIYTKVILPHTKSYAQVEYMPHVPFFSNQAEARKGKDRISIPDGTLWDIFNPKDTQTNYRTNSPINVCFTELFKPSKITVVYNSGRQASITVATKDNGTLVQQYELNLDYTDRTSYHKIYIFTIVPQMYTAGEGYAYEGELNYIDLSGYFWLDQPHKFKEGNILIDYTHPSSNALLFKQNNKYYVMKNTL